MSALAEPLKFDLQPPIPAGTPQRLLRSLIVGAGEAGRMLARDLRRAPDFGLTPIGFVDDDLTEPQVLGLPVLGTTAELRELVAAQAADVVLIAIPSLPAARIRHLVWLASGAGVPVRYLPSFVAALERDARASDLRRMRVDRLLGRPEVHVVRPTSRETVEGKRVLVTGAGGSIGSELCRQVHGFDPSALYLLDHDESNLHRVQLELTGAALLDSDELIIADIRDADRIRQIIADVQPEVIFHAAAHKHLPLLERHPCEGVKSNVVGTRNVVEAAIDAGVERFILISTDKAADPTSILGATKLLAEMVLQSLRGMGTRLASVRFGNVLGSRGSFLSVLAQQFENGEPITVTHPEVTRFFMTIEEAAGLVIEAAGMADAAETFVLDMGEPVQLVDLVLNYARELQVGGEELAIRYTGLRPGEKLHEALFSAAEDVAATSHPRIWCTQPPAPVDGFAFRLERLCRAATANRPDEVRRCLGALLPRYTPPALPERAELAIALAAPYPDGL